MYVHLSDMLKSGLGSFPLEEDLLCCRVICSLLAHSINIDSLPTPCGLLGQTRVKKKEVNKLDTHPACQAKEAA